MTEPVGQLLAQVSLQAVQGLIYAVPSAPQNIAVHVTSLWICSIEPTNLTFLTLRYGKGAGALTALNSLFNAAPIEPRRTYLIFDGSPIKMQIGFKFEGFADIADKLVISIWGDIWQG